MRGSEGDFQDVTPRSFEEDAGPEYERKNRSETNKLAQSQLPNNFRERHALKNRSMLLTPN